MTRSEIRQLAIELAKALVEIAEIKRCDWIREENAIQDFPFSKVKLKELRLSGKLEYRYHWKYIDGGAIGQGRRRRGSIIYHRVRLTEYVDNL